MTTNATAGPHLSGRPGTENPTHLEQPVNHTDPTAAPVREQLLDALDFSYCQGLGYSTPEELLDAYDASRTAVVAEPTSRAAVLLDAADDLAEFIALHGPTSRTVAGWGGAVAWLRRLAAEAQQQECPASISGHCLAEAQSETACATDGGECVHGGRPGAEAQQQPGDQAAMARVRAVLETEAVVGRSALDYRGLITSALIAVEEPAPAEQQPAAADDEETPSRAALLELVRDFLDPDPCSFDHHGYCQAHSWLCGGSPCPHGRARQLLAEADAAEARHP